MKQFILYMRLQNKYTQKKTNTSEVNILAHVPMHQAITGLEMRPLFMDLTIWYSSTPPTCIKKLEMSDSGHVSESFS